VSQEQPTKLPRWGTNPPGGTTTITEPNETEKDHAFQPGHARRSYMNWLLNLAFQWFGWLSGRLPRVSDTHPDHALPLGSPPSMGAIGVVGAGDFSAVVYQGGHRSGTEIDGDPVPSPEHTYLALTDVYWDLSSAGVWTPSTVSSNDPAPALAPDSIRVYEVKSDATDRSKIVDFRSERIRTKDNLDIDGLTLGSNRLTGAEALVRRLGIEISQASTMTCLFESFTSDFGVRLYVSFGGRAISIVWGARLTDGSDPGTWTVDRGYERVVRIDIGKRTSGVTGSNDGGIRQRSIEGFSALGGETFTETDWDKEGTVGSFTHSHATEIRSPLKLGVDSNRNTSGTGQFNVDALLKFVAGAPTLKRLLVFESPDSAFGPIRLYVGEELSTIPGSTAQLTINARWNNDAELWERDSANVAYQLSLSMALPGFWFWSHAASEPPTWIDGLGTGLWNVEGTATTAGVSILNKLFPDEVWVGDVLRLVAAATAQIEGVMTFEAAPVLADTHVEFSPPSNPAHTAAISNQLHAKNTQKAWGVIEGGQTAGNGMVDGFNATVDYVSYTDRARVTLQAPMASANYGVEFSIGNFDISWPVAGVSSGYRIIDASTFDLYIRINGVALLQDWNFGAGVRGTFSVYGEQA